MKRLGKLNPVIGILLVVALLAALLVAFWPGSETRTVSAEFPRTVSLYEGSDVKILGVAVGTVDKVTPSGTTVQVELSYDSKYKLPKDVKAAVISPSVVGDRFVQMTPAYNGGPVLGDKAKLGVDRTAMPLELDQIFGSINDLNLALGPDGANKPGKGGVGPLTRLIDTTARNFGGQGVQFNKTLKDLGAFTKTLADNKEELFSTLAQVGDFTKTLRENDTTVREFNDSLAGGAQVLAGERQELAAVLRNLSVAMREVRGFIKDNRKSLTRNISGLNQVTKTFAKRREALDEILRVAPAALNNLYLAGNNREGTLDTRANVGKTEEGIFSDPAALLCAVAGEGSNEDQAQKTCDTITAALKPPARPRAPFAGESSAKPRVPAPIDKSLGGLMEVSR